jgi:hypothetical protein
LVRGEELFEDNWALKSLLSSVIIDKPSVTQNDPNISRTEKITVSIFRIKDLQTTEHSNKIIGIKDGDKSVPLSFNGMAP